MHIMAVASMNLNGKRRAEKNKKDISMKLIKYFIVLSLCFFLCSCPVADDSDLEIDIGDYEGQLSAWNSQNLLDYQLSVEERDHTGGDKADIYVKNGIPESSDPPSWLEDGWLSTIPEFYSYIKQVEEGIRNVPKSDYKRASFKVSYNTEYHYPNYIATNFSYGSDKGAWSRVQYKITLKPLEE
jgi:hypothetical protein